MQTGGLRLSEMLTSGVRMGRVLARCPWGPLGLGEGGARGGRGYWEDHWRKGWVEGWFEG